MRSGWRLFARCIVDVFPTSSAAATDAASLIMYKERNRKSCPWSKRYTIGKSHNLRENQDVWSMTDPYSRCKVNKKNLSIALEYYTKDELACLRQSPNKKDVICVLVNDQKQYVYKCFMTGSIHESFRVFKNAHPDSKIGLTYFYSFWDHDGWSVRRSTNFVYAYTVHEMNAYLAIVGTALTNATFTLQCHGTPEEAEVLAAAWETGDLIEKPLILSHFQKNYKHWWANGFLRIRSGLFKVKSHTQKSGAKEREVSCYISILLETEPWFFRTKSRATAGTKSRCQCSCVLLQHKKVYATLPLSATTFLITLPMPVLQLQRFGIGLMTLCSITSDLRRRWSTEPL